MKWKHKGNDLLHPLSSPHAAVTMEVTTSFSLFRPFSLKKLVCGLRSTSISSVSLLFRLSCYSLFLSILFFFLCVYLFHSLPFRFSFPKTFHFLPFHPFFCFLLPLLTLLSCFSSISLCVAFVSFHLLPCFGFSCFSDSLVSLLL